jgi:predicted nucleotidyltransferase component of viral defense system
MILDSLEEIKKLSLIAMFSDDDLMEVLVLKGGNAIDLIYNMAYRSSIDIDLSIEGDFDRDEIENIEQKLKKALKTTFSPIGFEPFDISFQQRPKQVSRDMADIWGGYLLEFKLIESEKFKILRGDPEQLRRNSAVLGPNNKRKFRIDISKFEYCKTKRETDLEGYTIYVYTPEMIVIEKLRAICQQMPEYADMVANPTRRARSRDFFDIYTILDQCSIDMASKENMELILNIFRAKRVPLRLLGLIPKYREYHAGDFVSVKDTVNPGIELKDFDFYFDYVINAIKVLEPFWKV